MTLWVCEDCESAYSVGAPRCPTCGGVDYRENGDGPRETIVPDSPLIEREGVRHGADQGDR